MKNTGTCPKCNGKVVIKIPGAAGAYGSGNNIPAGVTIFSSVKVSRYLCGTCGFSEEWIDNHDDLTKLERKYGTATH
jgi:DNA-directed RNA polymerase subunit RPC12/RpoP